MANIAKLNVMLVANTTGFVRGLAKGKKSLTRFRKSASRLVVSLKGFLINAFRRGAIAVAAFSAGLVYLVNRTAKTIDANAKLARSLGITFNQLRSIQMAAGWAGVSADELNNAFSKMNDTVGAAMFGEQTAVDAFEQIGISMDQLNRMQPEEQFRAIANAINAMEDPAQRMAAARDIFGRGGGKLLELFRAGNTAVEQASEKVKSFGLALDAVDTSNIETMNDRMGDIMTMFEGIGTQLAAKVAPAIALIAEDTIAWVEEMGGIESIVDGALAKLEDRLGGISSKSDAIMAAWKTIGDVWKAGENIVNGIGNAFGSIPGGGTVKKIATWNPVRSAITAQYGKHKSDMAVERMQERAGGPMRTGPGAYIERFPGRLQERAAGMDAPAQNSQAVEAAIQQRQAEFMADYERRFGFTPEQFSGTPQQMRAGGDMNDRELHILQQIAHNTALNKVAFAG